MNIALELDAGRVRWWLYMSAGAGTCSHLLVRMLGRKATPAEVEDMSGEALAELCNLTAGHIAGILGAQGVDVTIGIPQPADAPGATVWRHWEFQGHPLALALRCVEKEPAA